MKRLAVAAISARALAQQAAREGFEVVALDCFGDRDTRQAAAQWRPIGDAHTLQIDGARLLAALDELAASGAAEAWIVGSGFDGRPDLLASGARRLPFAGNDAATVRRVRDAHAFFGTLGAHGIAHPTVRHTVPDDLHGWLVKDSAGCGGAQVRRAQAPLALGPTQYLQREARGTSMSATFVADGARARVLGCNEIIVSASGDLPYLYSGVIGPLPTDAARLAAVQAALDVLVPAFGVRGLGSLDFLRDADGAGRIAVLELNPRPSASLTLYPHAAPLRSHLHACLQRRLPEAGPSAPAAARGSRVVYARQAITLDAQAGDWLAVQPGACDLPPPVPALFERGQPLCSVEAEGIDAAAVRQHLAERSSALLACLERQP